MFQWKLDFLPQAARVMKLPSGMLGDSWMGSDFTNDDLVITAKIALAHLKEFPDYYTRLGKMEREADEYWAGKR